MQPTPSTVDVLERAYQYSLDLERHARIESTQSQLSPTDLALMSRIISFLRYDLPQEFAGDANYILERWQQK